MHNAKMNAETMLPKLCIDAKSNEVTKREKIVGTTNLSLFNNTPRNINSSEIGEMNTVTINPPKAIIELFR